MRDLREVFLVEAKSPEYLETLNRVFNPKNYKNIHLYQAKRLEDAKRALRDAGIPYNPNDFFAFTFMDQTMVLPSVFGFSDSDWKMKEFIENANKGEKILKEYPNFDQEFRNDFSWEFIFEDQDAYSWQTVMWSCYHLWEAKHKPIDDPDIRKEIVSMFIKPKRVAEYFFEKGLFERPPDRTPKTKRYNTLTKDGVEIQDASQSKKNLNTIDVLFEKLHKFGVKLNPKYVRAIRFRNISEKEETAAEYKHTIKTIILNVENFDPSMDYEISLFIHEYTHAIAHKEDIEGIFRPAYNKLIQDVYEKTGDEKLSHVSDHHILYRTKANGKNEIDTYGYNRVIWDLGYGEEVNTYSLKSIQEFACNLMGHYFVYGTKGMPKELVELCQQVEKYYR